MHSIAITGARGFIGSALTDQLLQLGYSVRLLVRSRRGMEAFEARGAQLIEGSLADLAALDALCQDADAVVHCAGAVRGRKLEDFLPGNLEGTENLVRVLEAAASPPPLLVLSSLAAREPQLSHYAQSKRLGEEALERHQGRLAWTCLRPPAVYGPGDRELLPLLRLMARGWAPLPASPEHRVSLIHRDDLVAAIIAWLNYSGSHSDLRGTFTVSGPEARGCSWRELAELIGGHTGSKVHLVPLPFGILDSLAWLNCLAAGVLGYAPMLTPEKLRELRHPDWVCDSQALRARIDWHPAISLESGLPPLISH